ncbi:MAG TPA: sigma-70 family RNA polymerase sigma factor [Candidatus Dormibacteraeota bacterium]|nr:sigma-70 family RNA polymerase sigma factor [Candidatus Dormibacteraeota bacterium]
MICIAPDGTHPGAPVELVPTATDAIDTLYHRYGADAVRRCARRLGDHALAEDAVHDGFIQVLQRLRRGDEHLLADHPDHVVQRNARWAASRLLERDRSAGAKARMLGDDTLRRDGDPWDLVETRLDVEAILSRLSDSQRRLLGMRYVQRLPDAVSAARLGMSVKAFRCRLDRALSAARQVALARPA